MWGAPRIVPTDFLSGPRWEAAWLWCWVTLRPLGSWHGLRSMGALFLGWHNPQLCLGWGSPLLPLIWNFSLKLFVVEISKRTQETRVQWSSPYSSSSFQTYQHLANLLSLLEGREAWWLEILKAPPSTISLDTCLLWYMSLTDKDSAILKLNNVLTGDP